MVAEKLGDVLDVRGLAATCAGAAELEERLCELGVLHIALRVEDLLVADLGVEPVEVGLLCDIVLIRCHLDGLLPT